MLFRKSIHAVPHADPAKAGVHRHDHVVFFPTVADFLADQDGKPCWRIPVHGSVFKPAEFKRLRRTGLWLIKRVLSRKSRGDLHGMALLKQRAGALLADNERWHRIFVRLGDAVFRLHRSAANGHFHASLELSADQLPTASAGLTTPSSAGTWISYHALMRPGDARTFGGRALLLPPDGFSVISDIDDTIKVTQVPQRRAMLANTFLKDFTSVPEMAALYQYWAAAGAAFHYVSASPWHLYPFLSEFLQNQGFPDGTFHLRDLRLMPADLHRTLRPGRSIKLRHARALLERFPRRRFLLVGDSGESDPLIYARLFDQFPRQIQRICIRNVTEEPLDSPRWQTTFHDVPRSRWRVFSHPDEISDAMFPA